MKKKSRVTGRQIIRMEVSEYLESKLSIYYRVHGNKTKDKTFTIGSDHTSEVLQVGLVNRHDIKHIYVLVMHCLIIVVTVYYSESCLSEPN